MFKIDDIKAGYLLEMDNGKYYIVNYNERNLLGIGGENTYCDLMNFDDNLYCDWRKIKINKIYGRTFNGHLDLVDPKDRKLLWNRIEEYKVGDKFIIDKILVMQTNGNCIKQTNYKNVEATITNIYNYEDFILYDLYFDNNKITIHQSYLDKLQRI